MKGQGWGADVMRLDAQALARGASLPVARPPGEVLAEGLRGVTRDLVLGELAARGSARLQDEQVEHGLDAVARAGQLLMRVRLRLACEVAERGLHVETGHRLPDWLGLRCPDLARGVLQDLSRVALAAQEAVHRPLLGAVLSGRMSLERAAQIHRALQRIRTALTPEQYDWAVGLLVQAGCEELFDDGDVQKIITRLLARFLPEKDHEDRRRRQHELRDVHESSLGGGSVRRLLVTIGDDADFEAVRAILVSPLAAPASRQERSATGEEDRRTPGQRRYDALMTVVRRGVAGTRGEPTTPKAMVVVSIDLEVLRRRLGDSDARRPGCGATVDGRPVTAETVRQLACDADIIPTVLGTQGEILDQGRARRLVTPGQRTALAARDGGCTIPGCSMPSTWCEAHHVIPWSQGGRSDLDNYALLCSRHHTWVHRRRSGNPVTATVSDRGVTWHLR